MPEPLAVDRALRGTRRANSYGQEVVRWRDHIWVIADEQDDGNHVHLTLTNPQRAPYEASTNDG